MICERCKKEYPLLIRCEVVLKVGGNSCVVANFDLCSECASRIDQRLTEAINDMVLDA